MKIVVLIGSPKGEKSITLQYVRYMQKIYPQHQLEIEHVVPAIKKLEDDEKAFAEVVERVRAADGVLWAFPLYIMLVHGSYKRFIELIWERGAQEAFRGKYAAALSTSIHFHDHIAHNYIHAICDDLGMRYVGGFSAGAADLLAERGRKQLTQFAGEFYRAVETRAETSRSFAPLVPRTLDYVPGPAGQPVDTGGKRMLILADAEPHQHNLLHMVERLRAAFAPSAVTLNLRDVDIKGGCLGCLRCGYDNECAYEGKDGYTEFVRSQLIPADVIVPAGAIHDRHLSARWKTAMDRGFFMGHAPTLRGKQFAFLISGPLSQMADLRQWLQVWVETEHSNLAGIVTDEEEDSATIDGQLDEMAARLVRYSAAGYSQPQTFLGVAGRKLFRDSMYASLRVVFRADDRLYKQLGFYDFPQKDYSTRAFTALLVTLQKSQGFREGFRRQVADRMVAPYHKVLLRADQGQDSPS